MLASCVMAAAKLRGADKPERPSASAHPIPIIHCTDLFHPHGDPDDHFDLATFYAIPSLDLKAVILDQGKLQIERPGTIPVSQLNSITGRHVPAAIGLAEKLRAPDDKALDQKARFQQGIELILNSLRQSPIPVAITAVGSMRDVVAAFNREPDLFRRKVSKVMAFIGEASDPKFIEWNVSLDPQAYIGLLRSGLPIYWVPCFDGGLWTNKGHASFWQARHDELLRDASPQLLQYFIYALEKETSDPIAFLSSPVDPERKRRLFAGSRNLWAAAVLESAADPNSANGLYGFSEIEASIDADAVVRYNKSPVSKKIMRFEIRNPSQYATLMTAETARLLSRLGQELKHLDAREP